MKPHGFSLVEVLVSLLILALLAPLITALIGQAQINQKAEEVGQAMALTQITLEKLRLEDPGSLPSSGCSSTNTSRGGQTYRLETCYCLNPQYCARNIRQIAVRVYTPNNVLLYQAETVYTQLR